jgi:hypothetical protein
MCLLLTEAEAKGSTIPEAVPVEGVVLEIREAEEQPPSRWR